MCRGGGTDGQGREKEERHSHSSTVDTSSMGVNATFATTLAGDQLLLTRTSIPGAEAGVSTKQRHACSGVQTPVERMLPR